MPRSTRKKSYFARLKTDIIEKFNKNREDVLDQFRTYSGSVDVSGYVSVLSQDKLSFADIKTIHYARQSLLDDLVTSVADIVIDGSFSRKLDTQNAFHRVGGGVHADNIKFVSANGRQEFIVRDSGEFGWLIAKDPVNVGTYNYAKGALKHLSLDVDPWIYWGNAETDSTTRAERKSLYKNADIPLPLGPSLGVTRKGNNADNILTGSKRDDKLVGYGGDDIFNGKAGADKILGGSGNDTVTYADAGSGIAVNLAQGVGYLGHAARQSKTEKISGVENVIGSEHADIIIGDGRANQLNGLTGADELHGGQGNDILIGGADADTLSGAKGRDVMMGGSGNDHLDGGTGLDVAVYSGNFDVYSFATLVGELTVDASLAGEGIDKLHDVEWLRFADMWVRAENLEPGVPPLIPGATPSVRIDGDYVDHIQIDDVTGDGVADFASTYDNGIYTVRGIDFHSGVDGALLPHLSFSLDENNGVVSDISLYEDVDSDGISEILIVASDFGGGRFSTGGGAVLVYSVALGKVISSFENGSSLFDNYGTQVVSVGDIDGDMLGDFLVGDGSSTYYGSVHAVSGATLADIYETKGGSEWAETGFGTRIEGLRDINGDGVDDFMSQISNGILSQPKVGVFSGADGALIYSYDGSDWGRDFGREFAGVGDIDGDSIDDFAISRSKETEDPNVDLWTTVFSGKSGLEILTVSGRGNTSAAQTVGPGDMTGDGLADLLIVSRGNFGTGSSLNLHSRNKKGVWESEELLAGSDRFDLVDLGLAQSGEVATIALSRGGPEGDFLQIYDIGSSGMDRPPESLAAVTDALFT